MTTDGLDETEGPAAADPSAGAGPRRLPVVVIVVAAVLLFVLVRAVLVESFVVPSASMEPTVHPGDRVLVAKVGGALARGDVIVFDGTEVFGGPDRSAYTSPGVVGRALSAAASALGVASGEKDYLKRVVGLPGDRVRCCTPRGRLSVNGGPVREDYLPPGTDASADRFDVRVPAGRLFVLGDNRAESADSRAHLGDPGGGMVPETDVVGHVLVRYWPLDRIGRVAGAKVLRDAPAPGGVP